MDLDGRNPRQLIEIPVKAGGIALSPNGAQIAFITPSPFSQKCKEDLYIVNWDGSDLRRLTNRPGSVNSPSWSFDGQWLAFSYSDSDSCVGGKKQINLMKSGGSGLIKFGSLFNVDPDPVWAPLPALQSGEMFTITESGAQLKLRASPSLTGEILERLEEGERILVLEGPEEADEYLWWQVRVSSSGREGWVAENPGWFAPGLP
jgi:dipeptidyl aminopeptidase/acylaminoacyl peptidase